MELRTLTEEDHQLIALASQVIDANVDADGFVHTVGAAIRDSEGKLHAGVNVHHFTGGPCAELVALGAARASGARDLTTIVAVADSGRGLWHRAGVIARSSPTITRASGFSCRLQMACGALQCWICSRCAMTGQQSKLWTTSAAIAKRMLLHHKQRES